MKNISKLNKIRLILLLPTALAFLFFGTILLSLTSSDSDRSSSDNRLFRAPSTEISNLLAKENLTSVIPTDVLRDSTNTRNSENTPIRPSEINRSTSSTAAEDPGEETTDECNPYAEYCNPPGANLLDDVLFNQSHDGSFENPICTLQPDGSVSGKGCSHVGDNPTHYQADRSALLPINSQAFFTEGGSYQRPEYVRQEVAGTQQCEEKLTSHGNNSFKIFSRGGYGLKGGLCMPMKSSNATKHAGINFRVAQNMGDTSNNVPVTFRLGYISSVPQNNTYFDTTPSLSEDSISWVASETITSEDYGGEGDAERYAGGFLEGQLPANAQGFCIMAESAGGNGIDTFWDGGFASTDANACENALDHSDGVDRSCGGYACGNIDPTYKGNYYTDFDQEYYTYDMPTYWNANQCHYESASNGADSPYGNLFVGLDLNSCDPNYAVSGQRNLHPTFECTNNDNWTYGYSWTGGIKDFSLLQYLDCAMGTIEDPEFKGTKSNPFFCSQILRAYSNTSSIVQDQNDDPAFRIRYSNTYPGLAMAIQAEGQRHFWKVPLLGSAVGTGVINFKQVEELQIDPYLIGMRNSGSGLNNMIKYSLGDFADYLISLTLRTSQHLYTESMIEKNEVLVSDLLAKGPVCTDNMDPITKIHYGPASGDSDRAIFGFADDEGSSEHIVDEKNIEITKKELCNLQFRDTRVVGAECTFHSPGSGIRSITFTEDNINNSLSDEGYVTEITPTLPLPIPPGTPDDNNKYCESITLCGMEFDCVKTMRDVYNQCVDNREVDEISGNPFIRQELPNGWKDLQLFGVNKLMESTWYNEYIHYNHPIRHENVGIDVNQVVSIYDHQQPNCDNYREGEKPAYCDDNSVKNEAMQVCRRVTPYDCGCNETNFATCLLNCPAHFKKPDQINTTGLDIEGTPLPTPSTPGERSVDTSIRAILNNSYPAFLESLVRMLEPKEYEGDGGQNYEEGQIYKYNSRYLGGFHLANTGPGSQCSSVEPEKKTGASQVRLENYYAYVGQIPRMNERIGFAATNNKDGRTVDQLEISSNASVGEIQLIIERGGEAYPHIALPYCDLLSEEERNICATSTDVSCDCLVRSCEQQYSDKLLLADKYLPLLCEKLPSEAPDAYNWLMRAGGTCVGNLKESLKTRRFLPDLEQCKATPKNNINFNCDPMASYLISQGFDSPELQLAACDNVVSADQCSYEKFGVHLITGPTQEVNYNRAENLGLKWKMEVITEDTPGMIDAMAHSVNTFSGKTVFRFCNADQGETGSKVQDQSCAFRTELTGSSAASGEKAANMISSVAAKTTKPFLVSPVNEPISEHWAGGDPNDDSNATTMSEVSAFYKAFADTLNADSALRAKVEIGGPTYNVTAYGNYANFERFHTEFTAKDKVDYWTINIYNNDDLPADISLLETQFNHVKSVFNDSKLIGINETGDFQHNTERLKTSFSTIGSDARLKYGLLFNAFGGWGDDRGVPLLLSDGEMRQILSGNRVCKSNSDNMCLPSGDIAGLFNPLSGERNSGWTFNQCYGPTRDSQLSSLPPFSAADRALIEQCKQLGPALGVFTGTNYGDAEFGYFHSGLDLDGYPPDKQIPVYAAGSGTVKTVVENPTSTTGYGTNIVIDHGGIYTRYAHLENVLKADGTKLQVGETVTRDTMIGLMGTTGNSEGVHLHFEVATCLSYSRNCFLDPTSVMLKTYTRGVSNQPPSSESESPSTNQCYYGDIGSGSFENYECLMVSTSNLVNSLPGGARVPWQVLWAILYSESWHKCSESHVKHNQTGLAGASLLGYTRSGDRVYAPIDKCSGNPNQLALHLDANLVDKIGRGVGQFLPSTFDFYSATSDWQYCTSELGVLRNEQSSERFWDSDGADNSFNNHRTDPPDFFGRVRVGDSLCAATIKLAEDNKRYVGNYVSPSQWTEEMVKNAAKRYHGSCGNNESYCNLVYDRYLFALEQFKDLTCNVNTTPTPPLPSNATVPQ